MAGEAYNAARSASEKAILQSAWIMLYGYLDANRTKSFGHIGWRFIQFDITGERLLDILTPLFGGAPEGTA